MPRHVSGPYTGRIVVRLAEMIVDRLAADVQGDYPPSTNRLLQIADQFPSLLPGLGDLLRQYPGVPSQEIIAPFSVPQVLRLESVARHSPFPPIRSLVGYFVLDPRRELNAMATGQLLARLSRVPEVDVAYRETELRNATAPKVSPGDETIYPAGDHFHFDGSFVGINAVAPAVWGTHDGSGIGFVDLEAGWNLTHDDLPKPPPPVFNENSSIEQDHGAATLGVVLGQDNGAGVVGIAPGATLRKVVSHIRPNAVLGDWENWDVVPAILDALVTGGLVPGDILLIEIETLGDDAHIGYPIEIAPEWFDAIRLAVGNGIVVIEPAGNGDVAYAGRNLDQWSGDWQGVPTGRKLMPGHHAWDSGAVVVSGCVAAVGPPQAHRRMSSQNYGQRVDCYAWGEAVYTAGYGDLHEGGNTPNQWYTPNYDGTSAASAIIAGAAILVQAMHEKSWGWRLSPAQVREVLRDWNTGTSIVDATGTQVGVMPDLGRIAVRLGTIPDVYVRDSLADTGMVPSPHVFQSPDIIIRSAMLANPAGELGQWSQLANQTPINDPIAPDTDNYLYVRIRNRSGVDAPGTTVRLYWSDASALVAPIHWNPIGHINAGSIAGGGDLHVVGPCIWHPISGRYPTSGHGCLVVVLDQAMDPMPPSLPAAIGTTALGWDEFLTYVGANNNIAWRNFTIVTSPPAEQAPWPFWVRGSWDEAREFELVMLADLAGGTGLAWEVPRSLGMLMERAGLRGPYRAEHTATGVRFDLTGAGRLTLPSIRLEPRVEYRCALRVKPPDQPAKADGTVTIRQLYQGKVVGQLTWSIAPRENARSLGNR